MCPEEGPGGAGLTRLCSALLILLVLRPVNFRCELGSPKLTCVAWPEVHYLKTVIPCILSFVFVSCG